MMSSWDPRLRAAFGGVLVTAAIMTAVAAYGWTARTAWSVAAGGAIAAVNLWIIARIVVHLMPKEEGEEPPASAKGTWAILALLKLIALFGGVYFLMSRHLVDPIPLVVGFGSLPIGIAIGSVVSDRSAQK